MAAPFTLALRRVAGLLVRRFHLEEVRIGSVAGKSSDSKEPKETRSSSVNAEADQLDLAKPGRAKRRTRGTEPLNKDEREARRAEEEGLDSDVVRAVSAVAGASRKGSKELRSDLLRKLQEQKGKSQDAQRTEDQSTVSSLLAGMKLDRQTRHDHENTSATERTSRGSSGTRLDGTSHAAAREMKRERPSWDGTNMRLFEGPGLGIFTKKPSEVESSQRRSFFDVLEKEDRLHLMTMPPNNAFEEMIRWTREGKLWKFPIDNEQGLDEESRVGFHEHIFLEQHLNEFPQKGPIRHFMELVAVGLSKNPYFSVQEKRDHIAWYAEYFKDKYHLIEDESSTTRDDRLKENSDVA